MNQKSILKDIGILFAITLISGLLLGFVYESTKDVIAAAAQAQKEEAYRALFPEAASFEKKDDVTAVLESLNEKLFSMGFGKMVVDEVVCAVDETGNRSGYLVTATSFDAYSGELQVMTGITAGGTVLGITYLDISETPGLGLKAKEAAFRSQYAGKTVDSFTVVKYGSSADNEIDAISGATRTSRAVTNCVNGALAFVKEYSAREEENR